MTINKTRDKIIDDSIALFAEKGYTETTIKEIAERTGIKSSSIYYHFPAKLDILNEILAMYMERMQGRVPSYSHIEQMAKTQEPGELLHELFFAFSSPMEDRYLLIVKILLHEQYRNEEVGAFVRGNLLRALEECVTYALQKLYAAGKILPSRDYAVYARLINAINVSAVVEYSHNLWESYSDKHFAGFLDMLDVVIDLLLPASLRFEAQ